MRIYEIFGIYGDCSLSPTISRGLECLDEPKIVPSFQGLSLWRISWLHHEIWWHEQRAEQHRGSEHGWRQRGPPGVCSAKVWGKNQLEDHPTNDKW